MQLSIETSRTILRLIKEDDLEQIAELNLDPEVRKFFPDGIQTKEQTKKRVGEFISFYKNYGLPCFVILNKISGEFIGRCGFGPVETGEIEVGYLIVRKFWGRGYASEVLKALLNWSKINLSADYIIAFAPLEHKASHRVMEKCNMKYYKDGIGHGVACKFYKIKNS
ncbi:GNAT family N-acetyltransferase [Legionella sp. CNM-1927-20]|uniref:GNAT family N-acetyltransferase n=1 Tax=Legionella sp. CNM-1927-20 TaxID=3422221 RepID=UPI00403AF823